MSSSRSIASGGSNFTRQLYFDPRADEHETDTGGYGITNDKLREKLSNLVDS